MSSPRGGRPRDSPSPSSTSPPPPPPDMGTGRSECDRVLEWESGLPTAAELTPLSRPLIPRALAAAFRIGGVAGASDSPTSQLSLPWDDDDDDDEEEDRDREMENAATGGGKPGKKKARMVWTAELHHRFIEVVAQLGDKAAVPKAIVQVMNVEGITREHVASHLQKYRLYLKRTRTTHAAPPRLRVMPPTHGFSFSSQQSTDASERSDYCEKV